MSYKTKTMKTYFPLISKNKSIIKEKIEDTNKGSTFKQC